MNTVVRSVREADDKTRHEEDVGTPPVCATSIPVFAPVCRIRLVCVANDWRRGRFGMMSSIPTTLPSRPRCLASLPQSPIWTFNRR